MWLWIIAALAAFFVKGLCGFANTLVFTSILGFGANNVSISPVELVLSYPTNVILAWKHRKALHPEIYLPLSLLVLAGSVPGAFLLENVNVQSVKVIFGFAVIMIALELFVREHRKKKWNETKESRLVVGMIGLVSGVLCGMFGIGALLAACVGRTTKNSVEMKANLSAIFIVENTFRIILYAVLGVFTFTALKQALLLVPVMLLGLWLGMKSSQYLDEKIVKNLVIALLILSGMILIAKNW